ncbi:uncharacterized protein EDB91DRAFT_1078209 [Suillus paluster]|uniref:uncharacterized protein n=1 Tax=Suillus paluster TaxID=48578 RepID=UPI001B878211|nr:uncharacterized protein EDB91DRAFT_1078209 [Suillus paluster]KAG1751419.1 hypothetical protein EDB91DRAFT_1078209 [Suillus paluster]
MATKSKVFQDDNKSASCTPPLYDAALSADSIQCRQPSVFSFIRSKQNRVVLSRIRDILSGSDFTIATVAPSINACTVALSAAEFPDPLQTPNIESVCFSDMRLACMTISDQALFAQLNLGIIDPNAESLRRFLGCPPDEVQVHEGDGVDKNKFVACLRFGMFQKRLHITQELGVEFTVRAVLWFEAHRGKAGYATPPQDLRMWFDSKLFLVPKE